MKMLFKHNKYVDYFAVIALRPINIIQVLRLIITMTPSHARVPGPGPPVPASAASVHMFYFELLCFEGSPDSLFLLHIGQRY